MPLTHALSKIEGWTCIGSTPLRNKVVNALKLDDYANMSFSDGRHIVGLYVGFYFTDKKIGAAHDPTVCYPGQGWLLSDMKKAKLNLRGLSTPINYSSMIGRLGPEKDLIFYWFQSFDKTSSDTFFQKIEALWGRVKGQPEDNAFVRLTISLSEDSLLGSRRALDDFISHFYPVFLRYMKHSSLNT